VARVWLRDCDQLFRVTTLSHFPSDVFLGAALGYTVTRYQVLIPR